MADDVKNQAHLARLSDFTKIGTNVKGISSASVPDNYDFDRVMKLGVESGLIQEPYVGGFLAGMVSILWPDPTNPLAVWDSIEARVAALCQELIDQNKAKSIRDNLTNFQNLLHSYIVEPPGSQKKPGLFATLLAQTQLMAPNFLDLDSPQYTLVYAVPMCTLYLGMLREQVLFWEEIHGGTDPDAATHYRLLQDTIIQYKNCLIAARAAAITWRKSKITVVNKGQDHHPNSDWYITDPLWIENGQPWVFHVEGDDGQRTIEKYNMTAFCNQRIDENYGASLDKLFLTSKQWLFMDYKALPLLMVGQNPQNVLAYNYPYYYFDTFCFNGMLGRPTRMRFDDAATAAQEGILTKIVIRGENRVDGFECFYGRNKVSTGFRGNPSSGNTAVSYDIPQPGPLRVPPGDTNSPFARLNGFIAARGNSGAYLSSLYLAYSPDIDSVIPTWTGAGRGGSADSPFYFGPHSGAGTADQCNSYVPGSVISHVWGYFSLSGIEGLCIAWVHPETLSYDSSYDRGETGRYEMFQYSAPMGTHTLMPRSQIYPESCVMEWARAPQTFEDVS